MLKFHTERTYKSPALSSPHSLAFPVLPPPASRWEWFPRILRTAFFTEQSTEPNPGLKLHVRKPKPSQVFSSFSGNRAVARASMSNCVKILYILCFALSQQRNENIILI